MEHSANEQSKQYVVNFHTIDTTWPADGVVDEGNLLTQGTNKKALNPQMNQMFSLSQQFDIAETVLPNQAQVWGINSSFFSLCLLLTRA